MLYAFENHHPRLMGANFVADSAQVIGQVKLERRASVWFGCVLRGDTDQLLIGEDSNVQDGSVLHTDPGLRLTVGKQCTIGHMVMLHGCEIGDGCLIGIKSTILNHARIGAGSLVGANSLVTEGKTFPDGSLILGSPAKVVRPLTDAERSMILGSAQHYVDNARRFREGLVALGHPEPEVLVG